MRYTIVALMVAYAWVARPAWAADSETAAALALSASQLAANGKTEKARVLFYKALAHDERCPDALLGLAKIFEQEGNTSAAASFLALAAGELGKKEGDAEAARKLAEARRRLAPLNPYAGRLTASAEEYAAELSAVFKKWQDALTQDEIARRINYLKLEQYVPAEKLPKVTVSSRTPGGGDSGPKRDPDDGPRMRPRLRNPDAKAEDAKADNVPPDVERALRAAGWTSIKGTWKLVRKDVYEVTDGRLEAQKVNGAISVIVGRNSTGTVGVVARYDPKAMPSYYNESDGDLDGYSSYGAGYGYVVKGNKYATYGPYAYSYRDDYGPYRDRVQALPDGPKNHFSVSSLSGAKGVTLEWYFNGKRQGNLTWKLTQEGPFVIWVRGAATLELPQAVGQ